MTERPDRSAVEAVLPHRDPFLFVDEVADAGDGWIETAWSVPADADWFRGHYPGQPVLPGVLISEHVFQSGALLVARMERVEASEGDVPVLTKIDGARFRAMCGPGDRLTTRVQLDQRVGPAFQMTGVVKRDGQKVLRIQFTVTSTGGLARLEV